MRTDINHSRGARLFLHGCHHGDNGFVVASLGFTLRSCRNLVRLAVVDSPSYSDLAAHRRTISLCSPPPLSQ
eukprot:746168-Hanusia_phi.AAC.1